MNLFELTNGYDLVYKWFSYLKVEKNIDTVGFVIMPNHVHVILYFPLPDFNLNKIISNGKRFMAYEIINRLKSSHQIEILRGLEEGVSERERKKGQKHKAFVDSFDAKPIFSDLFLFQKLEYIHFNPVRGKWRLVEDFVDYEHSSAGFYENGTVYHYEPRHYNELALE